MIWNNVAERVNSTTKTMTESGYARMILASITHWKRNTEILAMIGGEGMNDGTVKHI